MARNKKRIQLRKKKVIKRVKRHDNVDKTQTPEQKAKENEMLKVLLGRQMMPTPQQNQQNDKQQEKIERQHQLLLELKNELDAKRNTKSNLQKEITQTKEQTQKEDNEIKALKEQQKNERNKRKHEQRVEQEKEKLQEAIDKEKETNKEFDHRTKEYQNKQEIKKIQNDIKVTESKIRDKDREIELNKTLHEKQMLEEELAIKQAQLKAKEEFIQSPDFKNSDEEYKKVYKDYLDTTYKNERLNSLIEYKKQQKQKSIENDAMKLFISQQSVAMPSPTKKQYVETSAKMFKSDLDRAKLQTEIDYIQEEATKTHKHAHEVKTKLEDEKRLQQIIESDEYKNAEENLEKQKQEIQQNQRELESLENMNANQKALTELEIRKSVAADFDSSNTDIENAAIQIDEQSKRVRNVLKAKTNKIDEHIEQQNQHKEQREAFDQAFTHCIERFGDDLGPMAEQRLLDLINEKVSDKLPKNINDYDVGNLAKATEFVKFISRLDTNVLTDDNLYNSFKEHEDFINFDWDPIKHMAN